MDRNQVEARLAFAEIRMLELLSLSSGDLAGASGLARDQLVQEFFFHLVGAIEFLAQYLNETLSLGIPPSRLNAQTLMGNCKLPAVVRDDFKELCSSRQASCPTDDSLYRELVDRIWFYRHQVTHRGRNPFTFKVSLPSGDRQATFSLEQNSVNVKTVQEDMQEMLDYVTSRVIRLL